jgi:hypothetical protein
MREDTDVYMSGPCGGSTYEMPLPTGVDAVTLSVTVADDAEFELSGDWS